jgi:hypothetical protein
MPPWHRTSSLLKASKGKIMFKFKILLWLFTHILRRQIKSNPDFANYIRTKKLTFQIRTASGSGRYFVIKDGDIKSHAGLTASPQFTLSFKDEQAGFQILSAKESQAAFIRGVGSKALVISGDFQEVAWFQGLTAYLQPPKVISPYNRTSF